MDLYSVKLFGRAVIGKLIHVPKYFHVISYNNGTGNSIFRELWEKHIFDAILMRIVGFEHFSCYGWEYGVIKVAFAPDWSIFWVSKKIIEGQNGQINFWN